MLKPIPYPIPSYISPYPFPLPLVGTDWRGEKTKRPELDLNRSSPGVCALVELVTMTLEPTTYPPRKQAHPPLDRSRCLIASDSRPLKSPTGHLLPIIYAILKHLFLRAFTVGDTLIHRRENDACIYYRICYTSLMLHSLPTESEVIKMQPKIITCSCGRKVSCYEFTNTCRCGADYNWCGQRLASREQWGEETGESASDILSLGHYEE